MNTSPITSKRRGRPPTVKLTKVSKKRGRPRVVKPKFFTEDASLDYIKELSASISGNLGVPDDKLTKSLATKAASYGAVEQVFYQAPLKHKRRGNRPSIHLAVVLADCAVIHENLTGEDAKSSLRKIGGWAEDLDRPPPVLTYAEAVLSALKVEHKSLRRQARRAVDLFE